MALFWFLLALVLLVAALVILRLDARQRGGGVRGRRPGAKDAATPSRSGELGGDVADAEGAGVGDDDGVVDDGVVDDDEDPHHAPPAGEPDATDESAGRAGEPKLAPFQRAAGVAGVAGLAGAAGAAAAASATGSGADADTNADADTDTDTDPEAGTGTEDDAAGDGYVGAGAAANSIADPDIDTETGTETGTDTGADTGTDVDAAADAEALAAVTAAGAYPAQPAKSASEPAPLDPSEPTVESSPRLLDRVRALLPARRANGRANGRAIETVEAEPVDPLAGSPVVRWLEDREFAPTPTPAPEFRHGDFAGGLSALGTVSHGVFRGRHAIMGVTGGRTVLALRRDTSSDVVLDLSRPDVDAEPGFHDAGEVGALEARTSDYGRLDLIDRDRLTESVNHVPASVRRIWAEGEWVAATIDGVDDPGGWDDVVMALHGAADVVAPFPPIGGRARALPAEMDPGAPAAAQGPEADPTIGMDGEVGTGTHGIAPLPDPEDHVVVDTPTAPDAVTDSNTGAPNTADPDTADHDAGAAGDGSTATTAPTSAFPAPGAASTGAEGKGGSLPKRAGHLRLVPDRPAARDLSDVPVKADRGDSAEAAGAQDAPDVAEGVDTDSVEPSKATPVDEADTADATAADPVVEEPDPFAEIMEPSGPVEARGDVAADHLEPRPPLSRPTRGAGQAYPEDATVPPLAAGVATGGAGIKPLGSEDDEDEIRDEVERFDAARIDGGSDFDESATGRHGAPRHGSGGRHGADDVDPSEVTQRLSVAELAERMGVDPSEMRSAGRRRRRAKADDGHDGDAADSEADPAADAGTDPEADPETDGGASGERARGRERPGIEPDVERTARIQLPPDIRD